MKTRLDDPKSITGDINVGVSYFINNEGRSIHPFKYIDAMVNEDCNDAVLRFADNLNMAAIDQIIDEIPEAELGMVVMPEISKAYHKALLHEAAHGKLLPIANQLGHRDEHDYKIEHLPMGAIGDLDAYAIDAAEASQNHSLKCRGAMRVSR